MNTKGESKTHESLKVLWHKNFSQSCLKTWTKGLRGKGDLFYIAIWFYIQIVEIWFEVHFFGCRIMGNILFSLRAKAMYLFQVLLNEL